MNTKSVFAFPQPLPRDGEVEFNARAFDSYLMRVRHKFRFVIPHRAAPYISRTPTRPNPIREFMILIVFYSAKRKLGKIIESSRKLKACWFPSQEWSLATLNLNFWVHKKFCWRWILWSLKQTRWWVETRTHVSSTTSQPFLLTTKSFLWNYVQSLYKQIHLRVKKTFSYANLKFHLWVYFVHKARGERFEGQMISQPFEKIRHDSGLLAAS